MQFDNRKILIIGTRSSGKTFMTHKILRNLSTENAGNLYVTHEMPNIKKVEEADTVIASIQYFGHFSNSDNKKFDLIVVLGNEKSHNIHTRFTDGRVRFPQFAEKYNAVVSQKYHAFVIDIPNNTYYEMYNENDPNNPNKLKMRKIEMKYIV